MSRSSAVPLADRGLPVQDAAAATRMRWRHLLACAAVFALAYPLSQWQAVRTGRWSGTASVWDGQVPFVAWAIVPYMACTVWLVWGFARLPAPHALRAYTQRLLLATALACVVFNAWPTGFAAEGGPVWRAGDALPADLPGVLRPFYAWLRAMDPPHNLLPSLHATYALTLTLAFWPLTRTWPWRTGLVVASVAVVSSAVLTHQHTLADVAAGLLLAVLTQGLVRSATGTQAVRPDASGAPAASPVARVEPAASRDAFAPGTLRHADVASIYASLTLMSLALLTIADRPPWLRALGAWLAACCAFVAWAYGTRRADFLRKRDGRFPFGVRLLAGPYLLGYALAWRLDRRRTREPAWRAAGRGLWVGRRPTDDEARTLPPDVAVVDVANELAGCAALRGRPTLHVPMLDLVPPPREAVEQVRGFVAQQRALGRDVLLHCAMGHGRAPAVARMIDVPDHGDR